MRRNFLLIFLLVIFVISCVKKVSYKFEKKDVLNFIKEKKSYIKTYYASSYAKLKGKSLKANFDFDIFIKLPDNIRVDIFDPFGRTILYLISKNNYLYAYNPLENQLIRANLDETGFYILTNLKLSLKELYSVLFGFPYLKIKSFNFHEKFFDIEGNGYFAKFSGFWKDKNFLIKEMKLSKKSKYLNISFDKYERVRNFYFPYVITAAINNLSLKIKIREVKINLKLTKNTFNLLVPIDVNYIDYAR